MLRSFWTMLATGFTLAVIGLSMAMNFSFGFGLGTSEPNARILGALSFACDGLKALLPILIAWQWADGHRLAAIAGVLLFMLLLGYGMASAIGFAADNRITLTTTRENRSAAQDDAIADLASAERRLAALPPHRLGGVIKAEIAALQLDRLWDDTRACTQATLSASRDFCKRVEALKGELAIAGAAVALMAGIDRLKADINRERDAGAGKEADPQARVIASLTGLDMSGVRLGLSWLLALAVEAISAFGLFAITPRDARRAPHADPARQWRLSASTDRQRTSEPTSAWRLFKAG